MSVKGKIKPFHSHPSSEGLGMDALSAVIPLLTCISPQSEDILDEGRGPEEGILSVEGI